jgi:hypothetical protein
MPDEKKEYFLYYGNFYGRRSKNTGTSTATLVRVRVPVLCRMSGLITTIEDRGTRTTVRVDQ